MATLGRPASIGAGVLYALMAVSGALATATPDRPTARPEISRRTDRQLPVARSMAPLEMLYANFIDASGALMVIDAKKAPRFDGTDRRTWQTRYDRSLASVRGALGSMASSALGPVDRRALQAMQASVEEKTSSESAPAGHCAAAVDSRASGRELRTALYACFSEVGDRTRFEGKTISRSAAMQLLEQIDEPERRRNVFFALRPLWDAVNGDGSPQSPYRRLIRSEAGRARANIASAQSTLGLDADAGERWLTQTLEEWRKTLPATKVEPWDYRYVHARGLRAVEACAPRDKVRQINARYYADLGADLQRLGVIEDVDSRAGMAPVDFTDFARIGRSIGTEWKTAIPYVSVLMERGGLGMVDELAHEEGHAVHFAAIRTRPSLALPDDLNLVVEAIADIPAWSVFDPRWQQKYLGCSYANADAGGAQFGAIMLDLAWGLFEIRMAREPSGDPNRVWTEITDNYLSIVPHPEIAWWAVRGQLVDEPGYMVNYAYGAFITADLRAQIAVRIGGFDTGNTQWYPFVSAHLFRYGGELLPAELLRRFLGRDVSRDALLGALRGAH